MTNIIVNNLHFTAKQKAVGSIIEFTVRDAARNVLDLTPWTVTITLEKQKIPTLSDGIVTKLDQTVLANVGKCKYTFGSEIDTIALGEHQGNLKLVSGIQKLYWPVDEQDRLTYFTVEIQRPIG